MFFQRISAGVVKSRAPMAVLVIFLFVPFALAFNAFKVDDAYISFVYAKNLILGHGLTYNGTVVEGYSNFLWTLLVAPFIAMNFDPLSVARCLSLGSACVILLITEKLIRQLNPGISNWGTFLALTALAISTPFAAWTMGGLETMLMTLWVTVFVYLEYSLKRRTAFLSPLVVLAAALTRPEGVMLFPILISTRLIYKKQTVKQVLLSSLLFVIPFSSYLLWRYLTYGYWIPNTAFVKLNSGWNTSLAALLWLFSYWITRPLLTLLVVLSVVRLGVTRALLKHGWGVVIPTLLAFVFFVLYAGPDWMPYYRFLLPVLPLQSVLIAQTLLVSTSPIYQRLAYALLLSGVLLEVILAVTIYLPYGPQFGEYTDGLIRGGEWIRLCTNPQDVIAVVDAGALAYYGERPTIDILGLNDEHIAHSPKKNDPAYVLSQHPRVVQLHIAFSATGQIQSDERDDNNWSLFTHVDFSQAYVPWTEGTADPFFPFLFIRENEELTTGAPAFHSITGQPICPKAIYTSAP